MPYVVKLKVISDVNKPNMGKKGIDVFPIVKMTFPVESETGIARLKELFPLGKNFDRYKAVEVFMKTLKISIDDLEPLIYDGARYNAVSEKILKDACEVIKFFNDINNFNNHYNVFASGQEY